MLRVAMMLSASALVGGTFSLLGTPLPWLLGPLLCTAIASLLGAKVALPRRLRNAGQWAIGSMLGLYFTPQVLELAAHHIPEVIAGILWSLLLGWCFYFYLRWTNPELRGSTSTATLFFSSAIGGASEMAVLAERHGGRVELVAVAQSIRLLVVLLVLPAAMQRFGSHGSDVTVATTQLVRVPDLLLLAILTASGAFLMQRFRLPNAWIFGPLAVAAALTAYGFQLSAIPRWIVNLGQLFIGCSLGSRFTRDFLATSPRWLLTVSVGTFGMVAISSLFAWSLASISGLPLGTAILGTSPGGIAEMSITAKLLHLGVPLVTTFHVTRIVAVLLLVGPMYRMLIAAQLVAPQYRARSDDSH